MPTAGATALVWMVKLAALGVLLYTTFWLALVMVCVSGGCLDGPQHRLGRGVARARVAKRTTRIGLYAYDGFRIDPHVEDD